MGEMSDDEFLTYCLTHSDSPRAGFVPQNLARLFRLAGDDEASAAWRSAPHQIVSVHREDMEPIVTRARARLAQ